MTDDYKLKKRIPNHFKDIVRTSKLRDTREQELAMHSNVPKSPSSLGPTNGMQIINSFEILFLSLLLLLCFLPKALGGIQTLDYFLVLGH